MQSKISSRKRKKKNGENANYIVEKRKEEIVLDLKVLLDRINIRPGRDLMQNEILSFFINK